MEGSGLKGEGGGLRGELREGAGGLKCGEGRVCGRGAWWREWLEEGLACSCTPSDLRTMEGLGTPAEEGMAMNTSQR